jgi:hypothetical protein
MTISPPLIPGDEEFNRLADQLAATLSAAFGYSLQEAERHIRNYYVEYERSLPAMRDQLRRAGVKRQYEWSAADHFWHEGEALVLLVGYRLAGGDPESSVFLEWRKGCWDALKHGRRVPSPPTHAGIAGRTRKR